MKLTLISHWFHFRKIMTNKLNSASCKEWSLMLEWEPDSLVQVQSLAVSPGHDMSAGLFGPVAEEWQEICRNNWVKTFVSSVSFHSRTFLHSTTKFIWSFFLFFFSFFLLFGFLTSNKIQYCDIFAMRQNF